MKKHDEGYALVLVLVVLAVLSFVVASVLSVSLKNLQSQQSSIERMQDKYAAQGEIEKVVAKIESDIAGNTTLALGESYLTILSNVTKAQIREGVRYDRNACYLDLVSEYGTVSITCVIKISGAVTISEPVFGTTLYSIESAEITYESYTVTTVSSTETDGGEPQ